MRIAVWMKILLGLLGTLVVVLLILLCFPVVIRVSYRQGNFCARLQYSLVHIPFYPRAKKDTSVQETPQEQSSSQTEKEPTQKKVKRSVNLEQILYTLEVLPPVLLKTCKRVGKRIQISPLQIYILVAGTDPADTAILYGKLEAAMAAILPVLHQMVRIEEQDIQLFPDFCEEQMDFILDVGVRIRLCDLLLVAFCALGGLLNWFVGFRKRADAIEKT